MVVIRLSRAGTKKKPFYHLAVADKRSPRDGRFIERVGFYNPIARGKSEPLRVDLARIDYWLSVGAQLSPKVRSIVARARMLDALPSEPASSDSTDSSVIEEKEEAFTDPEEVAANVAAETTEIDAAAIDTESQGDLANQEAEAEANEVEAVEEAVAEATDEPNIVDQEESTDVEATVESTQEEKETVVDAADETDTVNTTEEEASSEDSTELSADTGEDSVDEEVADSETDAASVEGDSTEDEPAEATDESDSDSPSTDEDATEDQDKST